jgi:hypothetical protein
MLFIGISKFPQIDAYTNITEELPEIERLRAITVIL